MPASMMLVRPKVRFIVHQGPVPILVWWYALVLFPSVLIIHRFLSWEKRWLAPVLRR